MRRLVVVAFLAGCIHDPTVPCGDLLCASDQVCRDEMCVDAAGLAACRDHGEGDACPLADGTQGACAEQVCSQIVCGDDHRVGPETCDDGNQISGDGCSADCISLEVCGNHYPDTLSGEECDSGTPGLSGDGCSSTCTLEVPNWSPVPRGLEPSGRYGHAMAFDSARGQVVMFGGFGNLNSQLLHDTWELHAGAWRARTSSVVPAARAGHAMAYDAARHRVVMFGGTLSTSALDPALAADTWLWDGITWEQAHPATSPPARRDVTMAFDPDRGVTLLVGGRDDLHELADTWTWDGTAWTEVTGTVHPSAGPVALAWDPNLHEIVGATATGTWLWTGTTWVATGAGGIFTDSATGAPAAVASIRTGVVAFDGESSQLWNGTAWTFAATTTQNPHAYPALAADLDGNRAYAFGGTRRGICTGQTCGQPVTDTRETPDTGGIVAWQPVQSGIELHEASSLVYDARTGSFLSFGGLPRGDQPPALFDDTIVGDAEAWELAHPAHAPPPRAGASLAATADGVLLAGGNGSTEELGDTWLYRDGDWTELHPAHSFGTFARVDTVGDPSSPMAVLLGDIGGGTVTPPRTWVWDGSDWTERTTPAELTRRASSVFVWDTSRHRAILFGGISTINRPDGVSDVYGETWAFDGSSWTLLAPEHAPSPRFGALGAYEPRRGTIVITGGHDRDNEFADTWELDGTDWAPLATADAPPSTSNTPLNAAVHAAYDSAHARFVVFGAETRAFSYRSASAPADRCTDVDTDGDSLVGCADPDCAERCIACGDGTCSPLENHRLCAVDCE